MKNIKPINLKITWLAVCCIAASVSCERPLSEEAVFATNATTGEVFTDTPVGLGSDFYFPFFGSKPTAWKVDNNEGYKSNASMRFDIPNADDVQGNYGGAIFRIDGTGRDLTKYDALTFWAKASRGVVIDEFGFGQDFFDNKYLVTKSSTSLSTDWEKYIIPIPDASKLIEERGMFWYSAGTQNTESLGYTFWIDDLQFEKLGTLGQPQPAMLNGEDAIEQSFTGATINLAERGLTQTFNLGSGINQIVTAAPSYFNFISSDTEVARVNELGEVSIVGIGNAKITATLGGVKAKGSLNLEVSAEFDAADTPPARNPEDVVSIFSEAYTNVDALDFAVFNDPDVQIQVENFVGNQVVYYTDLDFVGLGWNGTVDVSNMTHLHLDVQVDGSPSSSLTVELIDFGANASEGGDDDTGGGYNVPSSNLVDGTWVGIDIPVNGFTQSTGGGFAGSPNLTNIARVVLVSNGGSFIVDNIYFYKE